MSSSAASGATAARVADPPRGRLGPRILSALVLAPATLVLAAFGGPVFAAFVAAGAVVVLFEIEHMARGSVRPGAVALLAAAALGLAVAASLFGGAGLALATALAGLVALLGLGLVQGRFALREAASFVGLSGAAIALLWLREESAFGRGALFWLFAVVWLTDTGAFAVGRIAGGPRLAPRLSPNKTLAGALGGLAFGIAAGLLAAWLLVRVAWLPAFPPLRFLVPAAALVSSAGQLGDLAESALKRRYGVKDSGALIPGHGGLFDRVDSLIAAALVYALLMQGHG